MRLTNKVAIITGGSRGIGKSIARAFLREGAKVAIAARTEKGIQETVLELMSAGEIIGRPTDISSKSESQGLVRQVADHFGAPDILVNAAGVQPPIGPFAEADVDEWSKNIQTNLVGTGFCCRAVLPYMIDKKRGKIINFAGGGANYSRPHFSAYGVAKAAIVRFTEILADELRAFRIQVNAVSPGTVETRMIDEILEAGLEKAGRDYESVVKKSRAKNGFDSLDQVTDLVCFLASESADWVTGKVLSAVWDPWREWEQKGPVDLAEDLYVLRRIDGKTFFKKDKIE